MTLTGVIIVLWLKVLCVDNARIPLSTADKYYSARDDSGQINTYEKPTGVMALRDLRKTTSRYVDTGEKSGFGFSLERKGSNDIKKPCSIIMVSNHQNSAMQSLLRKYRYDTNGVLIPSSVKYYIKMPNSGAAPVLLPLTGKAYSPLGGFIRYYKEVPPIPPSL